jgi:hypothetical protein
LNFCAKFGKKYFKFPTIGNTCPLALTLKDKTTRPTMNKQKKIDKMPTLQQNQKSFIPTLKANPMQHICFCPTH